VEDLKEQPSNDPLSTHDISMPWRISNQPREAFMVNMKGTTFNETYILTIRGIPIVVIFFVDISLPIGILASLL
jgi:hypothetical protein